MTDAFGVVSKVLCRNNYVTQHYQLLKTPGQSRQVLGAVPVTEVEWDWKDEKNKKFWIYGNEMKVCYCPDYPHQCCWGCVIL